MCIPPINTLPPPPRPRPTPLRFTLAIKNVLDKPPGTAPASGAVQARAARRGQGRGSPTCQSHSEAGGAHLSCRLESGGLGGGRS